MDAYKNVTASHIYYRIALQSSKTFFVHWMGSRKQIENRDSHIYFQNWKTRNKYMTVQGTEFEPSERQ